MSSLAAQISQNASLNSSILVDRSHRKATPSYLFTGRDADQYDLESIHALGANSFIQLSSVNPTLMKYEAALFSDQAKETDRTLLSSEAIEELDKALSEFMWLLSPHLLDSPTQKILEWLVRRFRINEFNVEAILALFLPYHETPHFAKMVTLLNIKLNSAWSFLNPYKSSGQNIPRVSLVTEMLKNSDVARFITSLLPISIKKGLLHYVILQFNAATLHEFIQRSKALNEVTVAYLLPALLEPLQRQSKSLSKDAVLGSYILLASLSHKCELSLSVMESIVSAVTGSAHVVSGDQFVKTLIAICETQVEIKCFKKGTVKALFRINDLKKALTAGCTWQGSETVLSPLANGLCSILGDDLSLDLLDAIIATPRLPLSVVENLTTSLLKLSISPETETPVRLKTHRLLSSIQQRYSYILSNVADVLSEEDDSVKEAADQLVISLSIAGTGSQTADSSEGIDLILASSNVEAKARARAVRDLVKFFEKKDSPDIDNLKSTLIARIQDTDISVLEALYHNHAAITDVFISDPQGYVSSLSFALASQIKPKRSNLRLHLLYMTSSFWINAEPATRDAIFHEILFPFLLFTKPRHKTAELVWDAITQNIPLSCEKSDIEWLTGCSDLVNSKSTADDTESFVEINFLFAERIAENILNSSRFSDNFEMLLGKLQSDNTFIKLLGYLVVLSLVRKLSGSKQLDAALRIISMMGLEELSGIDDLSRENSLLGSAEDKSFGILIVNKPNSETTLKWLQISVVAALAQIPKPIDVILDWLSDPPSKSHNMGDYVNLMRLLYQLANASTTLPILTTLLLQLLFTTLKDDSLAFLAGVWVSCNETKVKDSQNVSFLHATAFLEAHILEKDGMDFQTILPSLLVALQSSDTRNCQGSLECISRIRILITRKLSSVYRFDTIYGKTNRTIQYLDQSDLKRYLDALVVHRDHFLNDSSYLKIFHAQHLARSKGEKKKEAGYKHRVTCYLLSHVNATLSINIQNIILKSVATITNKSRIQILLPTIQAMIETNASRDANDIFAATSEELTIQILSCFDSAAVEQLNEHAVAWDVFLRLLRIYLRSEIPQSAQIVIAQSIENKIFAQLEQEKKFILCEVLLELGSHNSVLSFARRVISNILSDVPLIIHLLDLLSPSTAGASPRAAKRTKTIESPEDTLPRLSLLVEILGTQSLPGSLDLISHLLDILSKVIQAFPPSQADVSYIEQLLMSAVESAALKITEVPNISPNIIRLDVLVEVIRVSANPQTFHQALLLIAKLARLAPDSVLYNVMPVFTFMGSNVFHRDDSASFRVVQQTIDGILPVLVSSLKQSHSQPLELYLASKEFLRIFTDAANHIPRHRRNHFFAHLVDVLGPRDFSAPVCMLLLEKLANRVIRQPLEEVQNSLSLPLSIFQHADLDFQAYVASEILKESQRIVAHVVDPNSIDPLFLEIISDEDHSVSPATILRRRAQALIIFVGLAFKPKAFRPPSPIKDDPISGLIAQLIELATLPEGTSRELKVDEISEAARTSLNGLLAGMSVLNFIENVQVILESRDAKVQAGVLDILASRLPDVSEKIRPTISIQIVKIMASIKALFDTQRDHVSVNFAFKALKSISDTMCPGEESSLSSLVPFVLSATKDKNLAPAALKALPSMCFKLGPRIIPLFRSIISQSISVLRDVDTALFDDSYAVMQTLLSTIPTFWGSAEVGQVAMIYMDYSSSRPSAALSSVVKTVSKRVPGKVLVPTLLEMWPNLATSRNLMRIGSYFDFFARGLHHADRPTVLEHVRATFKVFLEAFDVVKVNLEAEARVISAFNEVVVKLNETAFKPLFRRLYDWGFVDNPEDVHRKVTFGHLYLHLLEYFKGLMVPYMSFLLQPYGNLLSSFNTSESVDSGLWTSVIQIVTRTLILDNAGFWRDDKLSQIANPLAGQIEVCAKMNSGDEKTQLQESLSALVDCISDDSLLKNINLNILLYTRSEEPSIRLYALECSEAIWRKNGGKLVGFAAETATFIVECSEDENDLVVKESFKLKTVVESIAGKIDSLS